MLSGFRRGVLRNRILGLLFICIVVGSLFVSEGPVLRAKGQAAVLRDEAGGVEDQIKVVLSADQAPEPGGVAGFTFAIKPLLDAPDLTVTWELPDGGELTGGPATESLGAVDAGRSVTQLRQVRFAEPGIYTVWVRASYQPDQATILN